MELEREHLETILRRGGVYDEDALTRIDLFDRPSWIYPRSRLLFELGWFGTSGYSIYEAKGVRIGLAIHRGTVRSACVYDPEPREITSASELERAIRTPRSKVQSNTRR